MQLFIDSANPEEVRQVWEWGLIDGVTTNPTLATKAGVDFVEAAHEILRIVQGPVSLEVLSEDATSMIEEGRKLASLGEHVVVKLPTTIEGLKALKQLTSEGIKTNLTLVFSATQALLVAKLGATYVSPFVGRIDDISMNGGDLLVEEIRQIYDNYGFSTQILYASVRTTEHVKNAALIGADVATIPFSILEQLVKHPLTDVGLKRFSEDWRNSGQQALV